MDTKKKQDLAGGRLSASSCTPAEPPAPAASCTSAAPETSASPGTSAAPNTPAARPAPARTRHSAAAHPHSTPRTPHSAAAHSRTIPRTLPRVFARVGAAALLAVALACPAALAFGDSGTGGITDVTEATADTVLTGEVKYTDDVVSVELPLSMHMDIKTDGNGVLDSAATPAVTSIVKNNTHGRPMRVTLYETKDPDGLLNDVVLTLNGKDISASVGPGTPGHSEQELVSFIEPAGGQDVLSLAASETSPGHVIPEQRTTVTITVKAIAL